MGQPLQVWRVARSFTFNGKEQRVGRIFDYVKLGCSERRLRQLADKRMVQLEVLAEEKVGK